MFQKRIENVSTSREQWCKKFNSTRLELQNKEYRIKEISRNYNILDATEKEAKEKYSISKESNKFAYQLDLTAKEIDIKDKAIETAKNINDEA